MPFCPYISLPNLERQEDLAPKLFSNGIDTPTEEKSVVLEVL
jgi:hypothetical protein